MSNIFQIGDRVYLKSNPCKVGKIIDKNSLISDSFRYYYNIQWSISERSYCHDHEIKLLSTTNNSNNRRIDINNFNKGDKVRLVHDKGKTPFKIRNINGDIYTLENLEGYYAGNYNINSIIDYYSNYDPSNGNRLVETYKPEEPKTIKLLTKRKLLKVNQND